MMMNVIVMMMHRTQMMITVIVMMIALYTNDDDRHHHHDCIVHKWWWSSSSWWSHRTQMMMIVIMIMIPSYINHNNRYHHDDRIVLKWWWSSSSWWSHRTQMTMIVIIMIIASYTSYMHWLCTMRYFSVTNGPTDKAILGVWCMRCSTVTDVWLRHWNGKFWFQRWQNVWSKFMKCAFCRIQVFLPHISALLLSNFVATDVYALSIIFLKSLPADFFPFLVWAKFWVPVLDDCKNL